MDDAVACGPECRADGDLTLARFGLRQHQVREVGAADQQDERDGGDEHEQRGANVLDDLFVVRRDAHREVLARVRVLLLDATRHGIHVGHRLLDADARLHLPDALQTRMRAARRERSHEQSERQPDVGQPRRETHRHGHDADDHVRLPVQRQGATDDAGIRLEMTAPQPLADDGDAIGARLIFRRGKGAARERRDTHRLEHARRRERSVQPLGIAGSGQVDGGAAIDADVLEHRVLIAIVLEIRPRHGHGLPAARLLDEHEQAIDVRIGERAQHHAVEHGEDRRVGADAERQGQHGHCREASMLHQHADGVSQILDEGIHVSSVWLVLRRRRPAKGMSTGCRAAY